MSSKPMQKKNVSEISFYERYICNTCTLDAAMASSMTHLREDIAKNAGRHYQKLYRDTYYDILSTARNELVSQVAETAEVRWIEKVRSAPRRLHENGKPNMATSPG